MRCRVYFPVSDSIFAEGFQDEAQEPYHVQREQISLLMAPASDMFDGISSARVASCHPGTNTASAWRSLQTATAPGAE